MSLENDAQKWKKSIEKITALDPSGEILAEAKNYFVKIVGQIDDNDYNPEDVKRTLKLLRGRAARLSGKEIGTYLSLFIRISEKYMTKDKASQDSFIETVKSVISADLDDSELERDGDEENDTTPLTVSTPSLDNPVGNESATNQRFGEPRQESVVNRGDSANTVSSTSNEDDDKIGFGGGCCSIIFAIGLGLLGYYLYSHDWTISGIAIIAFAVLIVLGVLGMAISWMVEHKAASIVLVVLALGISAGVISNCNSTSSNSSSTQNTAKPLTAASVIQQLNQQPENVQVNNNVPKGQMTDSRDGRSYKTIVIGNQTWMAENLNFPHRNSRCFKDNFDYCYKYGRLYTWDDAKVSCPNGWHLPSAKEFTMLFTEVGGQSTAGHKLKSSIGWNGTGGGTDTFGFSALPGGYWNSTGFYDNNGSEANFWTSSEDDRSIAYYLLLSSGNGGASIRYDTKEYGFSVRCVKD